MSLAASVRRTVRGWVSGVLTPSLNSNSAAALAGRAATEQAQAAVAPSTARRLMIIDFIIVFLPNADGAWSHFPLGRPDPQGTCVKPSHECLETILGNPRNRPETEQRYGCCQQRGVSDAWRLR